MHPPLAQPARPLRAGPVVSWRTRRHVTVHARPCRSARPAVSQRTPGRVAAHARPCRSARPAVSQSTPGHDVSCVTSTVSPSLRSCCCAYHSSLRRIVALPPAVSLLSRHTTQWLSRPPITIQFIISRHTPPAAKPSRAPLTLVCESAVSQGLSVVS